VKLVGLKPVSIMLREIGPEFETNMPYGQFDLELEFFLVLLQLLTLNLIVYQLFACRNSSKTTSFTTDSWTCRR